MASEYSIPTSIRCDEINIPFSLIHHVFAESSYGQTLVRVVRWERFKPQEMTNGQWVTLLGSDANNLQHLRLSLSLTRHFLYYCQYPSNGHVATDKKTVRFTQRQQELLLFTAIRHDEAEAIDGDIPNPLKTKNDDIREYGHLLMITRELFPPALLTPTQIVIDGVLMDRTTKLGKAFRAIEVCGYVRTALRAWDKRNDQIVERFPSLRSNLTHLAVDVVSGSLSSMMDDALLYAPIDQYLWRNAHRFQSIFNSEASELFACVPQQKRERLYGLFCGAKQRWEETNYFKR